MSPIRRFYRSSVRGPRLAYTVIVGALALWIVKVLVLNSIAEAFTGAAALGGIVEALLGNIVAACIFYLVFAEGPEQRARRKLRPYIKQFSGRVVGDAWAILAELSRASGATLAIETLDEPTLKTAMSAISTTTTHPNMVSAVTNQPVSWMAYFDHQRLRSHNSIKRVLEQARYLDADLVVLLTDIDSCHLFACLEQVAPLPGIRGHDLGWMANLTWSYIEMARRLEAYIAAELPE